MRAWVVVLATASAMALTAGLGFWQLGRAHTKIALQNRILEKNTQDVSVNASLIAINSEANWPNMLHRSVRLTGQWLTEKTVYLDNRQMGARQGFFVLTPLRLSGSDTVVVVQRGWIPRNFQDRTQLAAVDTPTGDVLLNGRIAAAPSAIFELGSAGAQPPANAQPKTQTNVQPMPDTGTDSRSSAATNDRAAAIAQNMDMQRLGASLSAAHLRLLPSVVLQTDAASEGLLRDWPVPSSGVAKHYGYAFQWFGLCATVLVLYVWLVWIAPRRRAAKSLAAASCADTTEDTSPAGTSPAETRAQ